MGQSSCTSRVRWEDKPDGKSNAVVLLKLPTKGTVLIVGFLSVWDGHLSTSHLTKPIRLSSLCISYLDGSRPVVLLPEDALPMGFSFPGKTLLPQIWIW